MKENLIPKKIVEELNKYIISQEDAKKNVAISLRNRYRRKQISDMKLKNEITPKNIILIGPTGVGKTEIARRLATITNSPFIKVEATKYTEVGYVGKDVESMIKDLVSITFNKLKSEKIEMLREKYKEPTFLKVAKLIKPYGTINPDEKSTLLEEVVSGKYDDQEIEIEKHQSSEAPMVEVFATGNESEEDGVKGIIDNIMSSFPGGKKKIVKMSVKNAIEYLLRTEIEQNIDLEELKPLAVEKVEEDGIIFIDEIDKIAEREGSNSEVSRQGVQRDILPIIEGTTVMTKYGSVRTEHILFIAAGAFTQASPSDLMPELQGRFPIKVRLNTLNKDDFVKILTEIDFNLLTQYQELLKTDKVNLSFTKGAIDEIAEIAIDLNEDIENIGARRLSGVIEKILNDIMFEAPYEKESTIKIGKKDVVKIFSYDLVEENLDNYIL
ncbi:ATP-dependent protease ATPase subunit HslU [Psychrilyobacter atlanticus]|uniref:ATP-dependent protease ATPase subunit HslU n=1 Tax=Psychrilyobacter atlanticus TaxID=271091 RepID=UPI0004157CF2|nr:ATP-dependent protease ATPase subunit HslU [Psychrilyobacter atlanticus]